MTATVSEGPGSPPPDPSPAPRRARPAAETASVPTTAGRPAAGRWFVVAVAVVVLHAADALRALPPTGLAGDAGIQYTLSRLTAEGAVPLRDFSHTWNVLSWYWNGLMYLLAGGQPTYWSWLVGLPTARLLVGLGVVTWGLRARLPGPWLVALAAASALVGEVPNVKYAIPALWLLVLVPVGRTARGRGALVARAVVAAVTALGHLELAVILGSATVLFDLVGARYLGWRERLARTVVTPAAVLVALALEAWVLAGLGMPVDDLVTALTGTEGPPSPGASTYDAVLLRPESLLAAWWPVVVAAPFVPLVWRRLHDPGRHLACLGLVLALVALRKADEGHVWAATTLLPATGVVVAHALWSGGPAGRGVRRPWRRVLGGLGGVLGVALAGVALTVVQSLALGVVLLALGGAAALVARVVRHPAASVGAGAALLAVGLAGSASVVATAAEAPDDALDARILARALDPELDDCLGPDREAWVVAEPLALYDLLDLTNPTPHYLFWSGIDDEAVLAQAEAGDLPAIVVVDGWPRSVDDVRAEVTRTWTECLRVSTPARTGEGGDPVPPHEVTVWTPPGTEPATAGAPGSAP